MGGFSRGYKLKYDSIDEMRTAHFAALEYLNTFAQGIYDGAEKLISFDSFQGNAAENCKSYFNAVYSGSAQTLMYLSQVYYSALMMYTDDLLSIDSDLHAKIEDSHLDDLHGKIEGQKNAMIGVRDELSRTLGSISDLVALGTPDVYRNEAAHQEGMNYLQRLAEQIHRIEDRHMQRDFREIDELCDSLSQTIDLFSRQSSYSAPFTLIPSKKNLETLGRLQTAMQNAAKFINNNQENIRNAENGMKKRQEDLQVEYEQRMQDAEMIKTMIALGACLVTTVAAVATGPVGAFVAVSAGVGFFKGGGNAMVDEMVEHGNLFENYDEYDWGRVGWHAAIGMGTEAASAYIGGKLDIFKR